MKRFEILFLLCLVSCSLFAQGNAKPFVIPELTQWSGEDGRVELSGRVLIRDKRLKRVGEQFVEDYRELFQKPLVVASGKARKGDIVLSLAKDKALGEEGYQLSIRDVVVLSAQKERGVYWGTRTLLQMQEQSKSLPKGTAVDIPQYPLRGFMIDAGRKYIPMDYLRHLIKILSYYKMNTLQVHLNDNGFKQFFGNDWAKTPAAFRLECDTYPGLTAKDGSYTKREFIELEKLGEQCGVEVIPEIDVPAHSLAFTHYRPEIGSKEYGMDHLDLFNPATYTFLDGLFKEYLSGKDPVFRSKHVNIGTDEYSNKDQRVVEKFREFTDHYLALVQSYGKEPMLWGALTHAKGTTPVRHENVLMNVWYNGYADPQEMKKEGYQMVSIPDGWVYIVPAAGYYYDYLDCKMLYQEWTPAHIGDVTFQEQDPQIEGGMFAVWNDHYGNGITVKDIHHRFYPAMQTLAVKCWTGQKTKLPYEQFDKQRMNLSEAPGVNDLGRLSQDSLLLVQVASGQSLGLPVSEVGYDYRVSFDVDCAKEDKGTVLFSSPNAVFYLSDPRDGKVGFSREGYLNTFNYRMPEHGKVSVCIEGDHKETRMYVNGKLREKLGPLDVYAFSPDRLLNTMVDSDTKPEVYLPAGTMHYQRTLFFPLQKAGNFRSSVSNLKVKRMK